MNAAVFLDRDNTLIHNDGDLGDPAQVKLIMGAASAIASLKGLNLKIIVVSNQGGVARGKYGEADVVAVNDRINELIRANSGVAIDRFYFCPYHPEGIVERYRREHPWRKPRPGMLLQAAKDFQLDLKSCWMIGDQMRDVLAGYAAGAVPILIGDPGQPPAPMPAVPPGTPDERWLQNATATVRVEDDFFIARNLIEAVRFIGQQRRPTNVAAAMKAQREEVVPRTLPRVATAAFDPDSVAVVASEHPLVARAASAPPMAAVVSEPEPRTAEATARVKTRGREQATDDGPHSGPRPARRTEVEPGFDEEAPAERADDGPTNRASAEESHADRPRPTRRPPGRPSPRTEQADEKPRSARGKSPAPPPSPADRAGSSPAPQSDSPAKAVAPAPMLDANRPGANPVPPEKMLRRAAQQAVELAKKKPQGTSSRGAKGKGSSR